MDRDKKPAHAAEDGLNQAGGAKVVRLVAGTARLIGIGLGGVARSAHRHGGGVRAGSAPEQGAPLHFVLGHGADFC